MAVVSTRSAVDLLLKETCAKFDQAEAGNAIDVLKRSYPNRRDLFDQNDLYHALKQLYELGAIDPDDGDTKLLELLAEKTSKKEEVLKVIKESTSTRKKDFVGRDADVEKILKFVLNTRVPGVNLYGESGVGKTTLAKEVSKQMKHFKTELIDLRDIKDMKTVYFLALEAFGLPAWDHNKERFYSYLQSLTAKTLLILDNVEGLLFEESQNDQETRAEFVEFLNVVVANEASKKGHLKVVLTSRIQISEAALKGKLFTEYNVQPLSKDVSKDFISKRVKSGDLSNDEQDKALFDIAELCRDKPYLLQGAEQLMRQTYTSPVDLLRKITTQIEEEVPEEFACISALFDSLPSDHLRQLAVKISLLRRPFSVFTAMKIAEISSDYGAEWDLEMLVNQKIITAEDVNEERKYDVHALLREFVTDHLCKYDVYKNVLLKAEQQFVEHFSEKLIELAKKLDKDFVLTYKQLIEDKANFDLTIDITTRSETFDLILHSEDLMEAGRVVVLFQAFKSIKERKELFGKWAKIMESKGNWLSSANLRCWESIQLADVEGTRNACETLRKAEESLVKAMLTSTPGKRIVAKGLFKYCWGKIHYMSSENIIDESSKQKKEQLLRQALCDLEESLDIHRKVYGDHTLTARTLNLIGNCYMGLYDPENALSFYKQAMNMTIKLVGSENHFDIPTYYNQLSQAYETLGDKEISSETSWSFQSFLKRVLGLSSAPKGRQWYESAVGELKKALVLQKDLGVDDSVDTATFQRNLANILIGLEQYDEALEYAEKSYKIRSRRLEKHPETVRILYLIGVIHEWRKDLKAALQSYEKAFEMEESLPEDNHSFVRKLLCDRLEVMCKNLKKNDKLEDYRDRIEEIRKIEDRPQRNELSADPTTAGDEKINVMKLDEDGGYYDFSKDWFYLEVPFKAVNQALEVKYKVQPNRCQPPMAGITKSISYFLEMSASTIEFNKPITVTLMHSEPGKEYGYETIVMAFNKEKFEWEELKELDQGSRISNLGRCKTGYVKVQINKLITLAVVSRLITDSFEVTPDKTCVVRSSVCDDVTIEFPEGAVNEPVRGTMKLVLMSQRAYLENDRYGYPCPILLIDGFDGVTLSKPVTITMPHPCPAKLNAEKVHLLRLSNETDKVSKQDWEDITEKITYKQIKKDKDCFLEIQVQQFSWQWVWYAVLSLWMVQNIAINLFSSPPKFVCFGLFKAKDGKKVSTLDFFKVTLICVDNDDDKYMDEVQASKNLEQLGVETSRYRLWPLEIALVQVEEGFEERNISSPQEKATLKFLPDKKPFRKQLDVCRKKEETQNTNGSSRDLIISIYKESDNSRLCQLTTGETKDLEKPLCEHRIYDISKKDHRGCFVMVNVNKFDDSTHLEERIGSKCDVENLRSIFKDELQFEVIDLCSDLKGQMILDEILVISKMDFSKYGCFALCIMSHGKSGYFYGSDGTPIPISLIVSLFHKKENVTLKGKPKLFFFQVCRGRNDQCGKQEEKVEKKKEEKPKDIQPSDLLVVHCCFEENESFRNIKKGTFFIQSLVKKLKDYANNEDILSILTMVTDELSSQLGETQVPQSYTTLTKKLFLKPKNLDQEN